MICSVKPVLTRGLLCSAKVRIFNDMLHVRNILLKVRPSIFIRDKSILSSERMLYKDYYGKSSVGKNLWSWTSRGLTPR
jgi:hypothetical protein